MVFGRLFDGGARKRRESVERLYANIVGQARDPWLFAEGGVPDTFDGRFEMMVWHLAFVVRRLGHGGAEGKAFAQDLFDGFLDDMDKAMREAGVGDIAVPKRLKKMVRVWFGRIRALDMLDAEGADAAALETILARNLYPEATPAPPLAALSERLMVSWRRADAADPQTLMSGLCPFEPQDAAA